MTNEVYGTIELDVSLPVSSNNEEMALLEANYNVVDVAEVWIKDIKGKLHKVKIHNWEIELDRYFSEEN